VVLLAVIIGGGYIAWRWSQDQYYVAADSKGEVVIYRGINQRIAGISMSRPYQQTAVQLVQVPSNYQQTVKATITASSLSEAQRIVANVRAAVSTCQQQYTALKTWVSEQKTYQTEVALAKRLRKPVHTIPKPGPQPPRAGAMCPPSTAFGIPASAIAATATGRS
jgi:protein phosphatase